MERINVTKSFLPPLDEYYEYLKEIWSNTQLTNHGSLLKQFEKEVSSYLNVQNLHFLSSGTVALQLALRALDITEGEIITTPFTYVATTSAILWERCKPVYVDIDPKSLCINPDKIEAAITKKTKAIMPVHVFGHAYGLDKIEAIAKKHKLKVIYDAAHAFDVKYKNKSLLDYGDISICSFHATKLFHTIEGGCIVSKSKDTHDKIELMKRFGHDGDDHKSLGINAKASEFQAAMGLSNLKYVGESIAKRKHVSEVYDHYLKGKFTIPEVDSDTQYNYSYYPVIVENEKTLKRIMKKLNAKNIHPRRYFYPSLNKLPYLDDQQDCPVSEDIASRIMCLPLYDDLSDKSVKKICEAILS